MKIVFCDMPLAQARQLLAVGDEIHNTTKVVEFDYSFGYSALHAAVGRAIIDLEEDYVYLVNSVGALQEFYDDITVEKLPSDNELFVATLCLLANDGALYTIPKMISEDAYQGLSVCVDEVDVAFAKRHLDRLNKEVRE